MKNQKENISVIVSLIIVVVFIGLVVFFLMNKNEKVDPLEGMKVDGITEQTPKDATAQTETTDPSQKVMNPNAKSLNNFIPVSKVTNLEKIDLVVGSGKEAKKEDTVSVHYTGAVAATGAIFQSSKDFGTEPVTFPLSNVIRGWTEGIPGMKIGGTRRLVIPSDMAYGATPPPNSGIPANADLVFDVELVGIK